MQDNQPPKPANEKGLQDGAILLMALGEDTASEVLKLMTPKEVQALSAAMAKIFGVSKEHVEMVLQRAERDLGATATLVDDTTAYVRNVLVRALGEERGAMLLERLVTGNDVSGIESLKWMDAPAVAELIRNEHPQIISSILLHLERDHAAAVLMQFSERLRADVVLRVSAIDSILPDALQELNEALSRVIYKGDKRSAKLGGSKAAAELLNFMSGGADQSVLSAIRSNDATVAQQIEDQMFTFDDLIKLEDKAIQLLLAETSSDMLVLALKGSDDALKAKILKNMSSRAAEALREEMESRGPVKLSDVEIQQKELLKIVRRLMDSGQISLGAEEDLV